MFDYQSVFPGERIVASWVPPPGSVETSHLVITDRQLAPVAVVRPEEMGATIEIRRWGTGVDLSELVEMRVVTEQTFEPSQLPRRPDPEIVKYFKAKGLPPPQPPPPSDRRFQVVVLQLLRPDGSLGYERTIGYYEEGGFTAADHQMSDRKYPRAVQYLRIHTQEQVRLAAEDIAGWIRKHCPGITG